MRDISEHNSQMADISVQMEDKKFMLSIETAPEAQAALRNQLRELVKLREAIVAKKRANAPHNAACV